jgi:hypothetical protein
MERVEVEYCHMARPNIEGDHVSRGINVRANLFDLTLMPENLRTPEDVLDVLDACKNVGNAHKVAQDVVDRERAKDEADSERPKDL